MDGSTLRRWRAGAGMSQVELAGALDVPQATISRWETGRHAIAQPRLLALALRGLALERESGIGDVDRASGACGRGEVIGPASRGPE